jgi:hypothetical protein
MSYANELVRKWREKGYLVEINLERGWKEKVSNLESPKVELGGEIPESLKIDLSTSDLDHVDVIVFSEKKEGYNHPQVGKGSIGKYINDGKRFLSGEFRSELIKIARELKFETTYAN